MKRVQIIGWKTYAVASVAIAAGLWAFTKGNVADGIKGIIFGFSLVALRDVLGKVLSGIDENRKALNNMRAAIEVLVNKTAGRK